MFDMNSNSFLSDVAKIKTHLVLATQQIIMQIMKERKSLAEQLAMKEQTTKQKNTPNNNSDSFSFGVSPVSSQKKSAAERIGYLGPR